MLVQVGQDAVFVPDLEFNWLQEVSWSRKQVTVLGPTIGYKTNDCPTLTVEAEMHPSPGTRMSWLEEMKKRDLE